MLNPDILKYNKKEFLAPGSILSCSNYHAKILPSGEYFFRIHDCITGIRLRGDLNDPEQVKEAIEKLKTLASGAESFATYIEENYTEEGKARREKERTDEYVESLRQGRMFTGKHFTGDVCPVGIEGDKLYVHLKKGDGNSWNETWVLQHVIWGFEQGEYEWLKTKKI